MLILASQSPRRADLLVQAGIPFQAFPSKVKETFGKGSPASKARDLALRKAREVALRLKRKGQSKGLVLGADTIVVLGKRILGKPKSPGHAVRMLLALSGRSHEVITGLALVDLATGKSRDFHESTKVWFRRLSPEEIRAYVLSGEPLDKAGAYGIQGRAGAFVRKISGDYFNVVGLPIARLSEELARP